MDKIESNLLIMAGTNETHPRLKDVAFDLYNRGIEANKKIDLVLVPDGEHGLHSMDQKLPESIDTWLRKINLPQI